MSRPDCALLFRCDAFNLCGGPLPDFTRTNRWRMSATLVSRIERAPSRAARV
jgi:hypothetical protein